MDRPQNKKELFHHLLTEREKLETALAKSNSLLQSVMGEDELKDVASRILGKDDIWRNKIKDIFTVKVYPIDDDYCKICISFWYGGYEMKIKYDELFN